MLRWITALVATLVLGGCIVTPEVAYRERYVPYSTYDGRYNGSQGPYREGDSYYTPSYEDRGDYYYSSNYGYSYGYDVGVSYFDYPVYYSMFWPISRWYYDPYVYPSYYYGVTWFPRSYLSLSYYGGNHWHGGGWLSYSPYRYAWVDSYYDWRPWYNRYPNYRHYYPTPRYGDARVEASRLEDFRRPALPRSRGNDYYQQNAGMSQGRAAPAYRGNRAADYGRGGLPQRQGMSNDGVRRVESGMPRSTPERGVFGNPTRANSAGSSWPRGQASGTRNEYAPSEGRQELDRLSNPRGGSGLPPTNASVRDTERGYALPGNRQSPRTGLTRDGAAAREIEPGDFRNDASTPVRSFGGPRQGVREAEPIRSVTPGGYRVAPQPETVQRPSRGWSSGSDSGYSAPVREQAPRNYSAPVREQAPRNYSEPVREQAPRTYSAPVRGFQAPRSEAAPSPSYSEPRHESPRYSAPSRERDSDSSSSYSGSRSSDSSSSGNGNSGVRRVGSSRIR